MAKSRNPQKKPPPGRRGIDVPEADWEEQEQTWDGDEEEEPRRIPADANEADVLEQERTAGFDDEDRDWH